MIEIDGSQGEGGGQIIRSSLALSAVSNQPIRLTNIRAGRKKSGLMRQHLTAVHAAAQVCNAKVEGAELGAKTLSFEPRQIVGGFHQFSMGTAGSTTLVAQTVLPTLMLADEPSSLTIEGGTHNPFAPPVDFLQRSFIPVLQKIGPSVTLELDSHGFYPAGGGRIQLTIQPEKKLQGFDLLERGKKLPECVTAIVSSLPESIGFRECETIQKKTGWDPDQFHVLNASKPRGPGNVVVVELPFENVTAIFTGFGKLGVKAEQVARSVLRDARSYLTTDAPVGPHLADQLMMPLGLAANQGQSSSFRTAGLTLHSKTHKTILETFLAISIECIPEEAGTTLVTFRPR